jgi:integrase
MKARVEHRVPLSRRAMEILRDFERDREGGSDYVFAGQREGSPLCNMSLLMILRRMKRGDITTAHEFRSTFSD